VDVNQREQPDNAGREDVSSDRTSGLAQVTEQQNTNANYHQQTDRNTCSVRTGLDSPRASNLQQESINQSVPITPELSRLLKLHDLMTKRHLCEVVFSNPYLISLFYRNVSQMACYTIITEMLFI
jgi:hypothetical protein